MQPFQVEMKSMTPLALDYVAYQHRDRLLSVQLGKLAQRAPAEDIDDIQDNGPAWRMQFADHYGPFVCFEYRPIESIRRAPDLTTPLLDEPALFLKFATLEFEPQAVLDFANAYGFLTLPEELDGGQFGGEPLAYWYEEIRNLRLAAIIAGLLSRSGPLFEIGKAVSNGHEFLHLITLPTDASRPDDTMSGPYKSVEEWEKLYLDAMVQLSLEKTLSAFLGRNADGTFRLFARPSSLISGLWLQFAMALDQGTKFKQCPSCGDYLVASSARADRKFCSQRCRTAASRRRKVMPSSGGQASTPIVPDSAR